MRRCWVRNEAPSGTGRHKAQSAIYGFCWISSMPTTLPKPVFMPAHLPDLNADECVWKQVKQWIARESVRTPVFLKGFVCRRSAPFSGCPRRCRAFFRCPADCSAA